jgi:quinol monooxygenase YgiN
MVTLSLAMTPLPGKTPEIIQTIAALATRVRTHWGCLEFVHFVRDEGGTIEVVQRWSDRAAADSYIGSREHRALVGAAETLCRHHTLTIT